MKRILWSIGIILYIILFYIVAKYYLVSNKYIDFKVPSQMSVKSGTIELLVKVELKNKTFEVMDSKDKYYISYHLLDISGRMIQKDNRRTEIRNILPGQTNEVKLIIDCPQKVGKYIVEIDVVKEDAFWYKEKSNKTAKLVLDVN